MTCSFCGSLLDGNEIECPYCGHKVSSKDDEPITIKSDFNYSPEPEYNEPVEDEEDFIEEEPEEKKSRSNPFGAFKKEKKSAPSGKPVSGNPNIILLGICALSLVISIITMFVCISISTHVKDLEQDMLSQLYVVQSDVKNTMNELQSSIDSSMTQVVATTTNNSGDIKITHSPTEVNTVSVGDSNKILFNCKAEGPDTLTFTWQKKSDSGEWVTIVFDPNTSVNEEYGLQVYDQPFTKTSEDKYSQIMARNLTEAAAGDYRCVVSDIYGHSATSDVATLHL